jgi:Family of unknown function (DUF6186)
MHRTKRASAFDAGGCLPEVVTVRLIAIVGWLLIVGVLLIWQGIGLVRGDEWPTLTDFFRAFMRPALGRVVLFGLWLWLGWHLFVRDWSLVSAG